MHVGLSLLAATTAKETVREKLAPELTPFFGRCLTTLAQIVANVLPVTTDMIQLRFSFRKTLLQALEDLYLTVTQLAPTIHIGDTGFSEKGRIHVLTSC